MHTPEYSLFGETAHFDQYMPSYHPKPELREHFRIPMVGVRDVESLQDHVAGGASAVLMQQVGDQDQ